MGSSDCRCHQHTSSALLTQNRLLALHQRADKVFRRHVLPAGVHPREELRVSKGTDRQ